MSSSTSPRVVFGVTVAATLRLLRPVIMEVTARGWTATAVCSPLDADQVHAEPLTVQAIPMTRDISPLTDLRSLREWINYLRDVRPDIVVGSTPKAALLSLVAARLTNIPVRVFQIRGARWDGLSGWRGLLLRTMDRLAAACATDVIAVSDSMADLFLSKGITSSRPVVLGRGGSKGVDLALFQPAIEPPTEPTIGFVGRLSRDKGIDAVLEVFERCRRVHSRCRLLVVGPLDAADPIDMETVAGLQDSGVKWLGPRSDVPECLQQMDVLVFPSIREGLPNAVIEAAACGVPTVGYSVPGVKDAIEPGTNGYLIPIGDIESMAAATLKILDSKQDHKMRASSRRFAEEHFDQRNVVSAFVDYLDKLRLAHSQPSAH
ncbi:MAG: glycosyltransferase family 4 protein [Myxococcales bacterium]|nr:glycosyltransferase family 4 protein [Myxococcales bacterium]